MISNWPTGGIRYPAIMADVAWDFRGNSVKRPGRNARRHYRTMSLQEIKNLPVRDIAAKNCHLFFWITGPFLAQGAHVPIMKAWGFKPSSIAFVWLKVNRSAWDQTDLWQSLLTDEALFMGQGHTTRQNAEYVVLGRRGSPKRLDRAVRQPIIAPRREHSRKPDEAYERVEKYAAGPYLDLFSRETRAGWTPVGNEVHKFDV